MIVFTSIVLSLGAGFILGRASKSETTKAEYEKPEEYER